MQRSILLSSSMMKLLLLLLIDPLLASRPVPNSVDAVPPRSSTWRSQTCYRRAWAPTVTFTQHFTRANVRSASFGRISGLRSPSSKSHRSYGTQAHLGSSTPDQADECLLMRTAGA